MLEMFGWIYKKGWATKIFLGFLAFSFIIGTAIMWGPGSWNFGGGNYVLKVGDITITPKEFLVELSLERNKNPDLPKEELKNLVYSRLLFRATLAYMAERDGFFVSKEEIKDFIRRSFTDKDGNFSPEVFENYLKTLGLTAKEFEDMTRKILLADRYKRAVYATSYADDATLGALLFPFKVQFEGRLYSLKVDLFEERVEKPTEEELKKFYETTSQMWREKEVNATERVLLYLTPDPREAKEIYTLLKEGKKPSVEPFKVFKKEELPSKGEYEEVLNEALKRRGVVVRKLPNGNYAVAAYEKTAEGGILPFGKVKEKVLSLYLKRKAAEYALKHKGQIVKEILEGRLPAEVENATFGGFELMQPQTWRLSYDNLLELLKGKRVISTLVGDRLLVFRIEEISFKKDLNREIVESYRLLVRNNDYLYKLQSAVQNFLKTHPEEVKINTELLNRI